MRECPASATLCDEMNSSRADSINLPPQDLGLKMTHRLLWFASGLALAALTLVLLEAFTSFQPPGKPGWPEAALVCLVCFATLAGLARQLPAQNVLLAAAVIAVVGGSAHLLASVSAIPFGPIHFNEETGPRLFDQLGWSMPLLWIIAVLNSRGVARLILRPYRKLRSYGFWLIALTVVLTVLFDTALEPVATSVKLFWFWLPTKIPLTWYGAPISNFAGWILMTGLILAFASPALINKNQRSRKSRPDYHPLVIWTTGMVALATVAAKAELWAAGMFGLIAAVIAVSFALRGARW